MAEAVQCMFCLKLKRSEGVGDVESSAAVETRQGGCKERDLFPPRTLVFSSSSLLSFCCSIDYYFCICLLPCFLSVLLSTSVRLLA